MTRGFSTIEILLALMIISSTIAGVVLVMLGIPAATADGHLRAGAVDRASANLQQALSLGLFNFSAVASHATTTSDGYDSALSVDALSDEFTERVTSTVSWIDIKGRLQIINRSSILTDYLSAAQSGCAGLLAGDWTHPNVFQYTMGPGFIPSQAKYRYPISAIAISSTTLAIGIKTANTRTEPDIYIFDIINPAHPVYQYGIDTDSLQYTGPGSLAIQGNTLIAGTIYGATFAGCSSGTECRQIQTYDITNPRGASSRYPYRLPTESPPFATGSSGQSTTRTLLAANGLLYIGLAKTGNNQGEEFNIVDIAHGTPTWIGGYAIGRTVNQIVVSSGYAYLATDNPDNELIILDVHDPAHIKFAGYYDAPGGSTFGYGEAVAVTGKEIALGRSFADGNPELYFLDGSTIPPTVQSSEHNQYIFPRTLNTDAIQISKFLAFVLTDGGLSIWNISNPNNPVPYADTIPLPGVANGGQWMTGVALACHANALYMASNDTINSGRLTIITGS